MFAVPFFNFTYGELVWLGLEMLLPSASKTQLCEYASYTVWDFADFGYKKKNLVVHKRRCYFVTLGMIYSISDTCSCDPLDFFLVFGIVCMEQNASWQSTKDSTTATVLAKRVAKQAANILNNLTGSEKLLKLVYRML